jgi:hypothetical protein
MNAATLLLVDGYDSGAGPSRSRSRAPVPI